MVRFSKRAKQSKKGGVKDNAVVESVAAAAAESTQRPSLWSEEGEEAFNRKWSEYKARYPEECETGLKYFMKFEETSCPCEGCASISGAPLGFVAKSLKGKSVQEMKNQVFEHEMSMCKA